MKKTLVALIVAATAALYPSVAGASTFKGTVLSRQTARHVLVVVAPSGKARTIHTPTSVRPGTVIRVALRARADGTYDASRVQTIGHVRRARVHGVIVRRSSRLTFLSAGGSVLVLHAAGRSNTAAALHGPQPGSVANVGVSVTPRGTLTANSITTTGQTNSIVVQATVAAVTPATATTAGSLTLTVNGQTLVIPLPPGTVLPATVVPNSTVTLTITFGAGGPSGQPCNSNCQDDEDDEDEDDDDDDEEEDDDDD